MRVDVIDTYDEFEALRENWERLYSIDPEAQFFLSWVWLSQLFLRRPDSWSILAARPAGEKSDYVAFFPLRPATRFSRSRGAYINEIYMGGNFWADYTGILCHPGYEEAAIGAFASHLADMDFARLHLEDFRASKQRIALLVDPFPEDAFRVSHRNRTSKTDGIDNLISPYVRLPDTFDDYLQTRLSANTRQKVRRYQRKLEAASDVEIVESSPATREQDLDALAAYWKSRWATRKGDTADLKASKYRLIVQQGLEAGIVYMPVLRERGRPVAILASFIDRVKKSLLFFVAGRDPGWKRLPSGLLLHAHSIRWAIREGFGTYDLLRGDEQYKYSLGAEDRRIACIRIETRTGVNRHGRLDPGSFDAVAKDLPRRLKKAGGRQRRSIAEQILTSWGEDESVLRRAEKLMREAGDDESANRAAVRLAEIRS